MTTVAGGGLSDPSAPSEVAMVCCLGSRSRARLIPKEDWRNQGMEILRLVLADFLEEDPDPDADADAGEPPPPVAPGLLLGLAAADDDAPGDAGGRSEGEDMMTTDNETSNTISASQRKGLVVEAQTFFFFPSSFS